MDLSSNGSHFLNGTFCASWNSSIGYRGFVPTSNASSFVPTEDPFALARIGSAYVDYLKRCRADGLSYLQPGRFLAANQSGAKPEQSE